MNSLKWKETTQEKQTRTKTQNIKPNYPFNQHNSKNTRIAGKPAFFHRLKPKQGRRQKQNTQLNKRTPKTKPT